MDRQTGQGHTIIQDLLTLPHMVHRPIRVPTVVPPGVAIEEQLLSTVAVDNADPTSKRHIGARPKLDAGTPQMKQAPVGRLQVERRNRSQPTRVRTTTPPGLRTTIELKVSTQKTGSPEGREGRREKHRRLAQAAKAALPNSVLRSSPRRNLQQQHPNPRYRKSSTLLLLGGYPSTGVKLTERLPHQPRQSQRRNAPAPIQGIHRMDPGWCLGCAK